MDQDKFDEHQLGALLKQLETESLLNALGSPQQDPLEERPPPISPQALEAMMSALQGMNTTNLPMTNPPGATNVPMNSPPPVPNMPVQPSPMQQVPPFPPGTVNYGQ